MVAPRVAGRAASVAVSEMPLVSIARDESGAVDVGVRDGTDLGHVGHRSDARHHAFGGSGQFGLLAEGGVAAWTVMRFPSCPSSFSRPDFEDWEMPSTPTMAAMPMLMPSADSDARTRRLRSPRLPTRNRSRPRQPGAAGVTNRSAYHR